MNEPKLFKKSRTNLNIQKKYLVIAVFMIVTLFMSSSYALLTNFDNSSWEVMSFKDNGLNLTLSSSSSINLSGRVQSNELGLKNNAVTLTFTNTDALLGDSKNLNIKKYEIRLVNKENTSSNLDYSYIKYAISFNSVKYNIIGNLKDTNNIIYTGYNLEAGKSKTIYLKLWIDSDTAVDADVKDKNFYGAIDVKLYSDAIVPASDELISKVDKGGLIPVSTSGYAYKNGDFIREYRYSGIDVNNYLVFNNENWRIVGLFDDDGDGKYNIKIVKDTPIVNAPTTYTNKLNNTYKIEENVENWNNEGVSRIYWNNSETNTANDWGSSGLMYYLNEENSLNNNSYYDSINNKYKDFIDDTIYYLGAVDYEDELSEIYNAERNIDNDSKKWIGKIGLLYPSDYGYASIDTIWMEQKLSNYDEVEKINNMNWLLNSTKNGWYWFMSPAVNSSNVLSWSHTGSIHNNANVKTHANGVYPVLNLKTDVVFVQNGDGTINNPYKLINN